MKKNNVGILLALVVLVVLTSIVLIKMDKRSTKDSMPIKSERNFKEEARAERKFVAVEMQQLRALVTAAKNKEVSLRGLGSPTFSSENGLTIINLKNIGDGGSQVLFGNTKDAADEFIKPNSTQLECKTEIINQDTVVQFPAYTLARLVQIYEAN